jgi:flagellar biosynthetic protein FliR
MDFLETLRPLAQYGDGPVAIFAGVFARISALVFFLPGLGEKAVPARVRLAAAFAISFVIAPLVFAANPAPPTTVSATFMMIAAEAVAGAVIGFGIRIAIFAIEIAGTIAAQSLSLSQLFSSGINDLPEPPVTTLLMMAAIALAISTGLHFKAVGALAFSYDMMPFGVFPGASGAGEWAVERAAFSFSAAMSLALPFVMLGFIYNLAIGAANRAMPQLMVAFVGAPAITLAGLVLLALAAPPLLGVWMNMVDDIFAALAGASR